MRASPFLLTAMLCLLWSSSRCSAQDDPLAVTLPNGRVVHLQTAEQKEKFEAARAARVSQSAAPKPADRPAASPAPSATTLAPSSTPQSGTPTVNTSAPAFTADYYGLPTSGAWVGRKVTVAIAYVRQRSADGETPVKFSAYTYNNRPGVAGSHMEGGHVTIIATESAARKLIVQCGTDYRYTAAGMTISMIHGVVQPLQGSKEYGVFVDY